MPPSEQPAPDPPVDRPTKMRWGCLVVIVIGGVLVGGTLVWLANSPRFQEAPTAANLQALWIAKSIQLYAQDHDGKFPTGGTSSNEAFRHLFPDYLVGEKSFFVPNSAWHATSKSGRGPDGEIGSRPDYAQCLERGENHWAYVSGLDTNSAPHLPLIADGFVEHEPGTYTDNPKKKGGVWKGTKAVVVFMDGSAKAMPISAESRIRVLRPDPKTGKPLDIFTREGGYPKAPACSTLNEAVISAQPSSAQPWRPWSAGTGPSLPGEAC